MRTKFTLCALLAAGFSAVAAPQFSLTTQAVEANADAFKKRGQVASLVDGPKMTVRTVDQATVYAGPQRVPELGTELEPIIFEDFSLFTTGSIEEPDYQTNVINPGQEFWVWNMKDGYTLTPGWGSNYMYPAGGYAFLDAAATKDGGARITTPKFDGSANGGVCTLRFDARTLEGKTTDFLLVGAVETNNSNSDWETIATEYCPIVTEEWQTFEVVIGGVGPTSFFQIEVQDGIEIIIDNISVFQYDLYVDIPVLNKHTNYTGETFDISWSAVEGADSYLVNVYSVNEMTGAVSYLYQDEPVMGTEWTVTEAVSGQTYYYTVRAVKGEYVSFESVAVEINDIEAPEMFAASEIDEDGYYVASWNDVPSAGVYNYRAYADRVAAEDGAMILTDESLEGLSESDGSEVTRSIENPDYMIYDEYYIEGNQGGWKLRNGAPCVGYVVLDAWHYINGNGDAALLSPELDLSKNGGEVKLNVSLWGELTEGYNWDDELVEFQTECAVALFTWDEELGDYNQTDLQYISNVEEAWNNYEVTIKGCTDRSIIGLFAVRAEGNLYIDNLKLTQEYKAGEIFRDPFFAKMLSVDTEAEVTIPARCAGADIWHHVAAGKVNYASDGYNTTMHVLESKYSELEKVGTAPTTSVENVALVNATARVANGVLRIANPAAETVNVYDLAGKLVYTNANGSQQLDVVLPANGVYMVKVGNKTIKVIR